MTIQETTIEINLSNLKKNLDFLKSKLNKKTLVMAVVKAFAYGSDSIIISKKLEEEKIDYLAVAYAVEGIELRKAGIKTPILVLHPQINDFESIIEFNLEPSIYSFRILNAFMSKVGQIKNYPFQIKFNTGLNRLGFCKNQMDKLISCLNGLKPKFIFSHLGASEDSFEKNFTTQQIKKFSLMADLFQIKVGCKIKRHILNTSGILNYPNSQFEMVRSGIGLYGFGNDSKYRIELKPIINLKTIISQKHQIKKGDSVGYNKGFVATNNMITATLPIGHADGISRQYGKGKGQVLVNGKLAPIIGNVCMDMIMIDVSKILCKEGDLVIFFDDHNILADDFAQSIETISYEIITALSKRIKRVILD
jgi:alanine racemase